MEEAKEILEKIKEYDTIFISRHIRPDGDAIGSTFGLRDIIKTTFPEKKVYLRHKDGDVSEYMSFLGEEGDRGNDEDIPSSLSIILDTANKDRISDDSVLNAKEVIKIDHHINVESFGNIEWVEDLRSSVCEMITNFLFDNKDELKISLHGAECLYTGMVTDSGRFLYSSTSGETLRLASYLLDMNINIENIYSHLDMKSLSYYKFKAEVYKNISITKNGVAWVYIDKRMQRRWGLSKEDASSCISFLSEIKDSIFYIAFIDNDDGSIRVRLRTRFMTCDKLGNKYHGGGHDRASGATVYSKEEMRSLLEDADALIKEYKENNEGWL